MPGMSRVQEPHRARENASALLTAISKHLNHESHEIARKGTRDHCYCHSSEPWRAWRIMKRGRAEHWNHWDTENTKRGKSDAFCYFHSSEPWREWRTWRKDKYWNHEIHENSRKRTRALSLVTSRAMTMKGV